MAKIEFMSVEAKEHFKSVVAAAVENDSYFGKRGLHNRIEYLLNYGDEGKEYVRREGGEYTQWRVVFGIGHSVTEINIIWQTRIYIRQNGKPFEECWTAWENFLVGGLIGHTDGSWGTHT